MFSGVELFRSLPETASIDYINKTRRGYETNICFYLISLWQCENQRLFFWPRHINNLVEKLTIKRGEILWR